MPNWGLKGCIVFTREEMEQRLSNFFMSSMGGLKRGMTSVVETSGRLIGRVQEFNQKAIKPKLTKPINFVKDALKSYGREAVPQY